MIVTPAPLPLWRSFVPKDPTHHFLMQHQCPSLATIVTHIKNNAITLSSHLLSETYSKIFPQIPPLGSSTYLATLWSYTVCVQDMCDAAANFLQKIVDQDTVESTIANGHRSKPGECYDYAVAIGRSRC